MSDSTRRSPRTKKINKKRGKDGKKDIKIIQASKVRKFTPSMRKKLVFLFAAVLAAFAVLLVRIVHINRDTGNKYKKQVLSQQSYDSTILPYKRGTIEDRNGSIFAYSERVYNVIVDSKLMHTDEGAHLEPTIRALKACFPELDETELREYLDENPTAQYKKILRKIENDRVLKYKEMENESLSNEDAPENEKIGKGAVWFEEEYLRRYPYNSVGCDIIGFVQGYNEGQYGLEEYYNDVLNGMNGRSYGFLNNDGELERTIKQATDGNNVITTVDVNIQSIAEKHIREFYDEYKDNYRIGPAADNVGCIVMNPNSGEIYAMASAPVFDLNDPGNMEGIDLRQYLKLVSPDILKEKNDGEDKTEETQQSEDGETQGESSENGDETAGEEAEAGEEAPEEEAEKTALDESIEITEELEQKLLESTEIKNAVWKNFCISDTYEPGSVMKPFTVAAAIDDGKISGYETYECNGALEVGEHVIHCHNRLGDGLLTVKEGVAKSCNVVLMDIAFALKKDDWLKYNRNFNFGLKTNIDLAGEVNGAETTFTEKMGQTDLAVASFGQGFNTTMIQMISGFSALINGGYYYQPHMASRIVNPEGSVVKEFDNRVIKQVISNETSDKIRDFCNAVVMSEPSECTGWTARPAGYTMGGKTGTAEKLPRSAKNYLISFMGYVPAEDPEVICYVVIDHPNVEDQSNSTRLATLMCRDIMTEVLRYLNIFPTLEITEEEREELSLSELEFAQSAVSDNSLSENAVSENAVPENGTSENGARNPEQSGEEAMVPVPVSENVIRYDPETGFPIDPNTGEILDPVTLMPVDETVPSDLDF